MSALTIQFDADVQAAETELPVTFLWNEKPYTGQKTATVDSLEMADAGWIQKYDVELLVRVAVFPSSVPKKNDYFKIADPITKDLAKFRIDKITPSQDGVVLTFHLVQENR